MEHPCKLCGMGLHAELSICGAVKRRFLFYQPVSNQLMLRSGQIQILEYIQECFALLSNFPKGKVWASSLKGESLGTDYVFKSYKD